MTTAGRLDIEIGANSAGLQGDMRRAADIFRSATQQIKAGAAGAEQEIAQAGLSTRRLAAEAVRLKDAINPLASAQRTYAQDLRVANALLKIGVLDHREYAQAVEMAEAKLDQHTRSLQQNAAMSGQVRAGAQQLSFNLGDMATMWGLGMRPMQIFASQSGQVIQALSLMTGGTSKLAMFLGGPWGIALTAAAMVLVPLIGNLLGASDASEEHKKRAEELRDALDQLHESTVRSSQSTYASINADIAKANSLRLVAQEARRLLVVELQRERQELADNQAAAAGPYGINLALTGRASGSERRIAALDKAVGIIEGRITAADETIRLKHGERIGIEVAAEFDASAAAALKYDRSLDALNRELRAGRITQEAYRDGVIGITRSRRDEEAAASDANRQHRTRRAAMSEEERELKQRNDEADRFIQSLREEADRTGLTARQLRVLELAKAQEAAVTALQREEMAKTWVEREKAIQQLEREKALEDAKKGTEDAQAALDAINREAQALGLVGHARETLLTQLEHEAELKVLNGQLSKALSAEEAAQIRETIRLRKQAHAQDQQNRDSDLADQERIKNAELFNDQLRQTADLLDRIGGAGDVLAGVLSFLGGDYAGIAGPFGGLLNMTIGREVVDGREQITRLGDVFREALEKELGEHATAVIGAIQSAGVGMAASNAFLGKQGTAGQVTSALGGMLGQLGGKALQGAITTGLTSVLGPALGSALGSVAPVIGNILGGIAGGLIGKAISGADRGSAIVRGGKVAGYYGDTAEYKDAAGGLAGGALDALARLAQQLGGTLDGSAGKASIGIRDGKFYMDPQGRGYTKASKYRDIQSFGTDQEAAVAALMQNLIEDGVLTGVRAGALQLIKGAKDLEEGIAKALQFDEIMDQIEAGSSALAQQVQAIRTQFSSYIAVMKEAGASVEDLTRAHELQARRIAEIIAQAGQSFRATFYTDKQNLDFAKAQIAAALGPLGLGSIDTVAEYVAKVTAAQGDTSEAGLALLGTLYELADAFAVLKDADEAAAAAAQEAAAQRAAEAEAARQQRAQRIAEAEQALRSAWQNRRGELEATADASRSLIETLRQLKLGLGDTASVAANYAARLAELRRVGGLAAMGDRDAGQAFAGVVQQFLPVALNNADSMIDYQRDVARVARYTDAAIGANEAMLTEAERQIKALDTAVDKLIDIDNGVISVEQAIRELNAARGAARSDGAPAVGSTIPTPAQVRMSISERIAKIRADMEQRFAATAQQRAERVAERDRQRLERYPGLRTIDDPPRVPETTADVLAAREARTEQAYRRLDDRMAALESAAISNAAHSRRLVDFFEEIEAEGGGIKVSSS